MVTSGGAFLIVRTRRVRRRRRVGRLRASSRIRLYLSSMRAKIMFPYVGNPGLRVERADPATAWQNAMIILENCTISGAKAADESGYLYGILSRYWEYLRGGDFSCSY